MGRDGQAGVGFGRWSNFVFLLMISKFSPYAGPRYVKLALFYGMAIKTSKTNDACMGIKFGMF